MLDLGQWIEVRLASAWRDLEDAKKRYLLLEMAKKRVEEGKEPPDLIERQYQNWRGLQPKEETHGT